MGVPGDIITVRRVEGVAELIFDRPGSSVNTLSPTVVELLLRCLDELEHDPSVIAGVVRSGKPDQFIAGADLDFLSQLETSAQAEAISRGAQATAQRLEEFPKPLVAAIHGPCMGGGLELVLACHYRVASDSPRTRLGLPEVQLGVLPGSGGTQRLPRLIGLQPALDMLLLGKGVKPSKARRLGLVDEVVPPSILVAVAHERARAIAAGRLARDVHARRRSIPESRGEAKGWSRWLGQGALEDNPIGRRVLFDQARRRLLKRTRGKYPAPERILEVVRRGVLHGADDGFAAEAAAFGELSVSEVARRLIGLFVATQSLKKELGTDSQGVAPHPVDKVAILGGGFMGGGIAYVTAAMAGLPVRVKDTEVKTAARALGAVREVLDERVRRRSLSRREADAIAARVTVGADFAGFRRAQVVIEAVPEELALKQAVLRATEAVTQEGTVFASNTSSLPIGRIADAATRPSAVVGMHYFSPVHRMPLLEVIRHAGSADWAVATAVALGQRQGKTVIVVRDSPGFFTSRILGAYLNEVGFLLGDGAAVEAVDEALESFGFPVGPFQLLDEVGLDVAAKVAHILHDAFGPRMAPAPALTALRNDGRLGRKGGLGFYAYGAKKKRVAPNVYGLLGLEGSRLRLDRAEIAERATLQMTNEAIRCLGEGVLRSARDGDVGAVLGLGFPAYLGGPFRYADHHGTRALLERMRYWEARLGARFEPAHLLVEHGGRNGPFHRNGG